jgi:23S rRNA (adenine2503-C2)-methyltransferase
MWDKIQPIQSADTNVMKFVFTSDSAVAEAVLYKYPTYQERTVVCCSTQSGCPVGCRFCGAGDNFVRSLTADEIVSQVKHLFASQGIDAPNVDRMQIMFMSMGEPMLNFNALATAIRELYSLYPKAALLISTSGPDVDYEGVIKLSQEVPTVGLQFSVHESTDAKRNDLIPFKKKLTLAQIAETGERWGAATGRQPFFNYCAHEANSTQEDADRIAALLKPEVWQATISVVCEREESIAAANERQRELANGFQAKLQGHGFSTRMFDPAGQDDIGGGCGQLWFVQKWMQDHPDKARPSIGHRLPVIHAPGMG